MHSMPVVLSIGMHMVWITVSLKLLFMEINISSISNAYKV